MKCSNAHQRSAQRSHARARGGRVYNVLFPLWMLVWIPSWLWLLLVPANYLVDRLVLAWSLRGQMDAEQRRAFVRRHTWKVCLAGFAADFVGALLLLLIVMLPTWVQSELLDRIAQAVTLNPFTHLPALLVCAVALVVASTCIYALDLRILCATELDASAARHSALMLAVATAPYLYLLPSTLLYGGM